eukprot:g21447.t1
MSGFVAICKKLSPFVLIAGAGMLVIAFLMPWWGITVATMSKPKVTIGGGNLEGVIQDAKERAEKFKDASRIMDRHECWYKEMKVHTYLVQKREALGNDAEWVTVRLWGWNTGTGLSAFILGLITLPLGIVPIFVIPYQRWSWIGAFVAAEIGLIVLIFGTVFYFGSPGRNAEGLYQGVGLSPGPYLVILGSLSLLVSGGFGCVVGLMEFVNAQKAPTEKKRRKKKRRKPEYDEMDDVGPGFDDDGDDGLDFDDPPPKRKSDENDDKALGRWFRPWAIQIRRGALRTRQAIVAPFRWNRQSTPTNNHSAVDNRGEATTVAATGRWTRYRNGFVTHVRGMDRTSWAWTVATTAGVVALLLMLSWQLVNSISQPVGSEIAETPPESSKTPAADGGAEESMVIVSQKEPPVENTEPDAPVEPTWRGMRVVTGAPVEFPKKTPTPDVEKPPALGASPFAPDPGKAKSGKERLFPLDDVPMRNTVDTRPPARSPFDITPAKSRAVEPSTAKQPDGKQPVVKQPVVKLPFSKSPAAKTPAFPPKTDTLPEAKSASPHVADGKPLPETSNPFAPGGAKQIEPAEKPKSPKPKDVARARLPDETFDPFADEPTLNVEIVRIDSKGDTNRDAQFLVTSLGTPITKPDSLTENRLPAQPDGWNMVASANSRNAVIPTQHGVGRPESTTILSSASVATLWAVDAPRLSFEIVMSRKAAVGRYLPIQLRVTNTGAAAATGVQLQIDLPESLAYHVGRKLEHQIGRLEPGETRTARLTPKVVAAGPIDVQAVAVADDGLRTRAKDGVATGGPSAASDTRNAASKRRPRPSPTPLRRATVECYDGQRIILIRK